MIDTDLKYLESELKEVINLFDDGENLNIKHRFKSNDDKVVNTITINGKVFAYGNLIGKELDSITEKRLIKRYAKLSLYKALSKLLNVELPWGALTGIRPTKLAYSTIEEDGDFVEFFTDTMKVSQQKTDLIKSILNTQKGIYETNDDNTDFFVFIPFCPSRCKYCSFISADIKSARKYVDQYVDALIEEIEFSKQFVKNLRSIYIGGGTPVALSDEHLDRVLSAIDDINTGVEFTVEAGRPDAITESNLQILKKHNVTRICINPQTFLDKTLILLGRNHTAQEIEDKFLLAKGMFDINMDLIAGLEGETFEDFKYSLDKAVSLSPENITVHTLCIKRGSRLAETESRLSGDMVSKMVEYAHEKLKESGYSPYYLYRQKNMAGNLENVGYTKPNKACVYNIDVMEEISSTVACGANAISKRVFMGGQRIEREASPKDVATYLQKLPIIKQNKQKLFND
ncbi:MAG: coproporphyrinogen dehydrogenase HemZ [Clostridiales bacterium]|nr:coproporphyrinogen dehydrogenase HemZ [Clostridiales bacterium]